MKFCLTCNAELTRHTDRYGKFKESKLYYNNRKYCNRVCLGKSIGGKKESFKKYILLSDEIVKKILLDERKYGQIADAYGVSKSTICNIKNGKAKAYSHIKVENVVLRKQKKLSAEGILTIANSNRPQITLARELGVTTGSLYCIKKGLIHKKILRSFEAL